MKKIGIVADNYKIEKFKKDLSAKGFEFKLIPYSKHTTLIKMEVPENKVKEVQKVCELVELHFKRGN